VSAGIDVTLGAGVTEVPAAAWDALVDENDPFLEHRFLAALERSRSVGAGTGWRPRFVLARSGGELVGAVPLYLKDHSYGEFVFDWAWAGAAERSGLRYYPKLVAAVPFTPATGRRLLIHPAAERAAVADALVRGLRATADETGASSIHVLFCTEEEANLLDGHGLRRRLGLQFHWHNRAPEPYASFDDFLGAFRSRNRKQVRHERAVAAGHGLRLATVAGPALGPREWSALEAFYEANIDRHYGSRYLTPAFFRELRETLADRVVATLAYRGETPVAGTLNFERGRHLYGRYWGCAEQHEMLHFELCYYQLIERAVGQGYTLFEAGAQGEHKLKRGLGPALTYSAHWIRHPGLSEAVTRFLSTEATAVKDEVAQYQTSSPYSRAGEAPPGAT
jgi:predicted N-acyltransferase